ncbi:MAG: hypothetical protein ACXVHQ_36665 [Solirubrobacteraceae bacterium]
MANTLRSTPAQAKSSVFPSRRVGSQPPTGIAPVCLWLLSQRPRLGRGAPRLSTGPSSARSRRRSPPTSWLAGLLLLALASALGLGAFTAPLASVPVVSALSLVGALGSSAVARQLAGIVPAVIGLPPRYGLLATASRAHSGRAYAAQTA